MYGSGPHARVYTTETDAEGTLSVRFGDGETAARLPAGRKNVTATYRQGIGKAGNVPAGSLKTLLDRPRGLRSAHNPADASGGVEPESREETRSGAPDSVRTFDRVVSLRDFADAARDFVGVAKARAECTWDGETRLVLLTAAGDDGAPVEGTLKSDLQSYLDARRDPNRLLRIQKHEPVEIVFQAEIEVDETRVPEDVITAARQALLDHFAFENVELGRAVHLSDLYELLQNVEGVTSLRITRMQFKYDSEDHPGGDEAVLPHLWLRPRELATIETPESDVLISSS
jgi:predicted phage baseplate assembly protein